MNTKLLVGLLTLLVGSGFGLQPVWADKKPGYDKGHNPSGYGKAHGYGRHGHPGPHGMGRHHGTAGHLIRGLLSGAEEMGLTEDQVNTLKGIQLDLDRTRIKAEADIKVAEREARALIDDEKSNLSAIEAKLRESAAHQVSLRVAAVKARRDAMAVLTPEQSKRVKMFHKKMREHRKSGKMAHGNKPGEKEEDDD